MRKLDKALLGAAVAGILGALATGTSMAGESRSRGDNAKWTARVDS